MPRRKQNIRELGMLNTLNASDHQYMDPLPGDGIEPELQSLASGSVCHPAESKTRNNRLVSDNTVEFKDYSVSHEWHRPYAEALFEIDEAKLLVLIGEAARAIVGRFSELLVSSVETDEFLDLQSAAYVITQLKKATVPVYTLQHSVA